MRRLAAACLIAAVPPAFAADPPLKAGFAFQAPAKAGDSKPAQKEGDKPAEKKEGDKPAEKKAGDTAAPAAIKPAGTAERKAPTRDERMKAAKDSYAQNCASYVDYLNRLESDKDKLAALKMAPTPAFAAGQVARLILADPKDDAAFDGLTWLMRYKDKPAVAKVLAEIPPAVRGGKPASLDVLAVLLEHHVDNPKLAGVVGGVQPLNDANVKLLTAVIEKSTAAAVKASAGTHLADLYNRSTEKPNLPAAEAAKNLAAGEKIVEKLLEDKAVVELKYGRSTYGEELKDTLRELKTLTVGKPLPELKGEALDGSPVSAADYKGKVLVLDVWATWCGPCRAMIPHEREMTKKLKDKPFAFVSISCDAKKETLTTFLDKEPMPWVHWFDGQGGKVNNALNIRFFPTVYVIDAKGVIRYKNVRGDEMEHAVEKLLEEAAGGKASGGQ